MRYPSLTGIGRPLYSRHSEIRQTPEFVASVTVRWFHGCIDVTAMAAYKTPHQYAVDNVGVLRAHWTGVLDAEMESVHQARIATRRLRAVLRIVDNPDSDRVKLCRRLGRALGAVREADVTQEVFHGLATRVPAAVCGVAAVRRLAEQDQRRARRRLARTLDGLKLRPLAMLRDRPSPLTFAFWRDWHVVIAKAVAARRHALAEAL